MGLFSKLVAGELLVEYGYRIRDKECGTVGISSREVLVCVGMGIEDGRVTGIGAEERTGGSGSGGGIGGTAIVEEGGRRVRREGVLVGRMVGMAMGEVGIVMEVGVVGMEEGVGMGRVIDPPVSVLLSKFMLSFRFGGTFWYTKLHWGDLLWAGLVLALASKMGICTSRFRGSSSSDPTTSNSDSPQSSTVSALASIVVLAGTCARIREGSRLNQARPYRCRQTV
jgi:hypothetical protein